MTVARSHRQPADLLLQAALNGNREHPAVPRTPAALAAEARAAVCAGARSLHLHPYDDQGRESLAPRWCAAALRATRAACPGVPISLTTSAQVEPDPGRRKLLVGSWTELPDLVTANMGEEGILELCDLLLERGIVIEAGLLSLADARIFVASGIAPHCVRAMVEPLDPDPDDAVMHAAAIESALAAGGIQLEQVHHGDGIASWAVNRRAAARGHGIRTGLEDTPVLPDGRLASGNGELVAAAAALLASAAVYDRDGGSVRIRAATVADIPLLARHRAAMFRDMGRLAAESESALVRATLEYLRDAIPRGEYLGWVAESTALPAESLGGAGVQLRRILPRPGPGGTGIEPGPEAIILSVYVEPASRRRGVAETLMRSVLNALRERNVGRIVLHASDEGRLLYERLGFVPTNEMQLGEGPGAKGLDRQPDSLP
jgi:uncharacterized protein (DUF849 family)/ribosomal protein S18 acetylase RimI-like enzyme